MNCKRFPEDTFACVPNMLYWCFAVVISIAMAASALAQEDEVPDGRNEEQSEDARAQLSADQTIDVAQPDFEGVPTKGGTDAARRLRDRTALFTGPGEPAADAAEQQKKYHSLLQDLERQKKQLALQHAQAEQEYRRALAELEKSRQQQQPQLDAQRAMLEQQLKQLESARANLAQQMSPQQMMQMLRGGQQQTAPPLSDGSFKVFALRHSKAHEAARVLSEVLGGQPLRLAVDERTNSLVLFADENTSKVAEALMQRLDQSVGETKPQQPSETLQLRIVWLLDGVEGHAPNDWYVSPQVVDALHHLNFKDPRVVCQQVTTLTMGQDDRRGGFNFEVPVLIKSQPWQFEGHGEIEAMPDERFNLKFDLGFRQMNVPKDTRSGLCQPSKLGGSIYTPLAHYTVMGTTTFVAASLERTADDQTLQPNQHLSAFVVYLDRAREYPASGAPSK